MWGCATAAATSRSCAPPAARCSRCACAPAPSPTGFRNIPGCRCCVARAFRRPGRSPAGLLRREGAQDDEAGAVLGGLELLREQPPRRDLIDQPSLGRAPYLGDRRRDLLG